MIEVRTCKNAEEFIAAGRAIAEYGAWDLTEERADRFIQNHPVERMHAAFDDGRAVGGAGSYLFDFTVPDGTVTCAGVTVVGVYPTHRRRGVLTAMMRAQLDDAHERGEPVAALWASDERIYGHFGYGMASLVGIVDLPRANSDFAKPLETRGVARYVEPEQVPETFAGVYDATRVETPGMFVRSRVWWELRTVVDPDEWRPPGAGPKRFVALEIDGRVDGYAVYRHAPKWEAGVSSGRVNAIEVMGVTPQATRELWRYLCDIEWVETVFAMFLPIDHPLFFILANPRMMHFRIGDGLWVRLIDVGAALSGRGYTGDGAVVFDVRDDFCPWNKGRWKLEGGEAARTRAAADIKLDVQALGSAYLGGFTFTDLARAGRIEEAREGSLARADVLFRSERAPWCPEIF
jgi:predicted acetyltransferase